MTSPNTTLTPQQRLQKATAQIMGHTRYACLSSLLLHGKKEITPAIPTARTDGLNTLWNPNFVNTLSDPELRFVLLHEVYHCLLDHITLWQRHDLTPMLANKASDFVINGMLVSENQKDKFAIMPKDGLYDAQFDGLDTLSVYRLLQQHPQLQQQGAGFDEHDHSRTPTPEQRQEIERLIRQGLAANPNNNLNQRLTDLLKPKIDWREALKDWLTTSKGSQYSSWRKLNKRYLGYGLPRPTGFADATPPLILAIDTSASIDHRTLNHFLTEVESLTQALSINNLTLLYWDTTATTETYDTQTLHTLHESTQPVGGGGTDLSCIFEELQHHPASEPLIIFTDGELPSFHCTHPAMQRPVLWLIKPWSAARPVPPCGTTIYLEE